MTRVTRKALAASLAALALAPASATASHGRSAFVDDDLTETVRSGDGTGHFLVHYDPATTTAEYARAGAADFEEAWQKLVGPGNVTELRSPVPDDDGLVDVYLDCSLDQQDAAGVCQVGGGRAFSERDHAVGTTAPGYIFLTPDQPRGAFRFRAAHELFHVIQSAYDGYRATPLWEATANWAADYALPDVDPGNSPLRPGYPMTCSLDATSAQCNTGYDQWLFFTHQTETYGPEFVHRVHERWLALPGGASSVREAIDGEIAAQSGGTDSLRTRYARYFGDLLDPARWTTTAVATHNSAYPLPEATELDPSTPDTGTVTSGSINHLATRFLRIRPQGYAASGPNDRVEITLTKDASIQAGGEAIVEHADGSSSHVPFGGTGDIRTLDLPIDGATVQHVHVPLINDTLNSESLTYQYRVRFLPGAPTPPANDERAGAKHVGLGAVADNSAYAGGNGGDEAPTCPDTASARRGVWYRFTTPNTGSFRFDATASDFDAIVSLYRAVDDGWAGCGPAGAIALGGLGRNQTYLVYVGRRADSKQNGPTTRLEITGPEAPPNQPPAAAFAAAPASPAAGAPVTLDASGSSDPDGSITRYEWDLDGDGTFETDGGAANTLSTSFPAAGQRTVGLRVTDSAGATATATRTLTVLAPALPPPGPGPEGPDEDGGVIEDTVPPTLTLRLGRQSLAAVLKRGLAARLLVDERARAVLRVRLGTRQAGSARASLAPGVSKKVLVVLGRRARRRLARMRKATVRLVVVVTDGSGNAARTTRRVTLRR